MVGASLYLVKSSLATHYFVLRINADLCEEDNIIQGSRLSHVSKTITQFLLRLYSFQSPIPLVPFKGV